MINFRHLFICGLTVTTLFSTAFADPKTPPLAMVSTQLYAEGWVDTNDAKVTVNVNAAVNTAGLTAVRSAIHDHLQTLAKGDWRITQFDRQRDNTGLERLIVQAEARIPQDQLTNIYEQYRQCYYLS